jgi:trans-aconitate methyltransferase
MENNIVEFDRFAEDYCDEWVKNLGKFGKYSDTAFLHKTLFLKNLLKNEPKSILDFGCGIGLNIPFLHDCFTNTKLYGCDVSSESIEIARKNYPYCDFNVINNINDLQIYNNIDCIFISTVLHHIPQNEHKCWIDGLYNILSSNVNNTVGGGYIVIFEHNLFNPVTKSVVKKSKVDEDATMLSPKYCKRLLSNNFYHTKINGKEIKLKKDNVKLTYTYFFPWRNKLFTFIERLLFWLPVGAQYCVYARK